MAMWGPGEATMWHEFQFLAAQGFGIVYANPRGSGGYGHAFKKLNYQDWGEGPAGDVLAAASEAADDERWVDEDRQVVTGGSYAGYLTAWIVAQDDRFKAAVAQRGVYDLTTFLGEGNAWRLVPSHFGGYPWGPRDAMGDLGAEPGLSADAALELLRRNSPLTYVDRIRTPLLIMHADDDLRTGVIQSEMLYKSLKILGRPVEYVRYPDAGHDLSRTGDPTQRMDRVLRIYEFLARYVMDDGSQ
jgi:dipeptidyl aminopeptidase/acylaminoacyl peptidase